MLTQSIPAYHRSRRKRLVQAHPGAAFLLPSWPYRLRNGDVHHPSYRADSSLHYLTGFPDPEACVLILPEKTVFFVQPRDHERELWEGARYGVEGAQSVFGADEAYPIASLAQELPKLLKGVERLFYRVGQDSKMDDLVLQVLERVRLSQGRSGRGLLPIEDPVTAVGEMRLFKDADEITLMRKACSITAQVHKQVMRDTRPGMNERDLDSLIEYLFKKEGCDRLAYGNIVAGGKNAACLHYHHNNEVLRDGDLLLIDAGGEYAMYAADITRTFPVGRAFSKHQAQLYDLVLRAQKESIALVKPGATLPAIHRRSCEVLIDGMLSLGLLKGKPGEILESLAFKRFYPHNTSHWLGLDVHDAGKYLIGEEPRPLEAGMVFTIEPGFYTQPSETEIAAGFQNIGIRIEDDILVTKKGCEVLTSEAPKEREEIEALRA